MERKPLVLAVEDNPTEQKVLRLLLQRFGYECLVAPNGEAALDMLEKDPSIDLILMDWQLQGMDGLECTRRIREVEARTGRYVPIIAVTARVLLGDKQKCLAAGMNGYLSKPFTAQQFQDAIDYWTAQKRASLIS